MRRRLASGVWLWQGRRSHGVGRLAQLVEHLVYTERVGGSSPSAPTIPPPGPKGAGRVS